MNELWEQMCRGVEPKRLVVQAERLETVDEVIERLARFGGCGWACEPDRVFAFDRDPPDCRGPLLAAEAWNPESGPGGASLSIRRVGEAWIVSRFHEADDGERALRIEETYASSRPGRNWRMRYRIYWRTRPEDGVAVWRPWLATFSGWESDAQGQPVGAER